MLSNDSIGEDNLNQTHQNRDQRALKNLARSFHDRTLCLKAPVKKRHLSENSKTVLVVSTKPAEIRSSIESIQDRLKFASRMLMV